MLKRGLKAARENNLTRHYVFSASSQITEATPIHGHELLSLLSPLLSLLGPLLGCSARVFLARQAPTVLALRCPLR